MCAIVLLFSKENISDMNQKKSVRDVQNKILDVMKQWFVKI